MQNANFFPPAASVIVPTNRITVPLYNISSRHNGHSDFLCEWHAMDELMERINSNVKPCHVCNHTAAWLLNSAMDPYDERFQDVELNFEV